MWTKMLCVAVLLGLSGTVLGSFVDDFNRENSTVIGNGWTESVSYGRLDPQISGNQVSFGSGGATGYDSAMISHTFEPATEISVDLAWGRDTWDQPCLMNFAASGLSVDDRGWDSVNQSIIILVNGTEWRSLAAGVDSFVRYTIKTNDHGLAKILANDVELWSGVAVDPATSASISVARQYWEWDWFAADNFAAVPEPATLGIILLGSLLATRRKR